MGLSRVGNHFFRNLAANQYGVVWEHRLRIHYNCVGASEIPKVLPLPIPNVTVNTRKGVFVNYAPSELAV